MKKNSEMNIEIEKFDNEKYTGNLKDFNNEWRNYWEKEIKEKYQNNNLVKKIAKLEEINNTYVCKILETDEENNNLITENIELGERIELQKNNYALLEMKYKQLQNENNELKENKGLVKRYLKQFELSAKNAELEQHNNELQQKVKWTGKSPLPEKTVNTIVQLKEQGYSQKAIANKLNVSTSSVSRYLQKN